jgi:hypothetical protein
MDAVQALELALVGAGTLLSRSPQFRAGQIEMWNKPVKNAAALQLIDSAARTHLNPADEAEPRGN